MTQQSFDVINHPIRMRIFQTLYSGPYSINQLSHLLPDVPRPSLYRHIHKMLDAGVIKVVKTRHVNGIEERFFLPAYEIIDVSTINDVDSLRKLADHLSIYGWVVAQDLARYLTEHDRPQFDDIAARDFTFYATDEEFLQLRTTIYQLLHEAQQRPYSEGRTFRRIFVLGHPLTTLPAETSDDSSARE